MGVKSNTFLNKYIKYSPRKIRQAVDKQQDNNDPAREVKTPKRGKKTHPALKAQGRSKIYEDVPVTQLENSDNVRMDAENALSKRARFNTAKSRLSKQILDLHELGTNTFEIARILNLPWTVIQRHLRRARFNS